MSDWISVIDRIPDNCEPVYVKAVMRFKRYKPQSQQFKNGQVGRWQEWNGYGWKNTDNEVVYWSQQELPRGANNA